MNALTSTPLQLENIYSYFSASGKGSERGKRKPYIGIAFPPFHPPRGFLR